MNVEPGDISAWYRIGGMMGFSADQVDRMTIGQMWAATEGFKQFHGVRQTAEVSRDDFMRVLAEETAAGRVLN